MCECVEHQFLDYSHAGFLFVFLQRSTDNKETKKPQVHVDTVFGHNLFSEVSYLKPSAYFICHVIHDAFRKQMNLRFFAQITKNEKLY